MTIQSIELYNFRIYKGRNRINLTGEEGRNIFIISGFNGFGKTTFLMSLVWCLYGRNMQEVDDLYRKEIVESGGYSKYVANSVNRLARAEEDHKCSVAITFTNINIPEIPCKEITVTRTFSAKGISAEEVEILIDGSPSELATEVGPEIFIREFIMPIEIAKFFFFDAEKIVNLAEVNTAEQRRKLSLAYSEVLGIKKYEDLRKEYEYLRLKLRQESASASERSQLEQLKADISKADILIEECEMQIAQWKEERSEKSRASRDIQDKLIKAGSSISAEELEELRSKEVEFTKRLETLQGELRNSYEIIPFAIAGEKLAAVSTQVAHEANHKTAQFKAENMAGVTETILTELMNEPRPRDLVIGHGVHTYYAATFEKLIRKHFFADAPQLPDEFKVLHEFSDSVQNELLALVSNIRQSFRESFRRINGDYTQARNELVQIRKRIKDAEANQEDPIIAQYRKEKELLDTEVVWYDGEIDAQNRQIGNHAAEQTQKTKRIEELSRKLAVSEQNKEKDELLTRSIAKLKDFIVRFKAQKKASLETAILTGLETLMHKKGFIRQVEVDLVGDDIDIVLRNKRGDEIRKDSLSKGEQQMYATALLRGLVEESDIEFPVFIDSPMQKFDERHAENIIRYFYPNISDQVVIFPLINKELTKKEYDLLSGHIAQTVLIHNIHEDHSEFMPVEPALFIDTYNRLYNHAN